jgi:hypothetical protein
VNSSWGIATKRRWGGWAEVDCPCCRSRCHHAETYELTESLRLLWVGRLVELANVFIICRNCGNQLLAEVSLDEIPYCTAEDLKGLIKRRASLVSTIIIFVALVFSAIPFLGIAFATAVWLGVREIGCWRESVGWAALALSFVSTVGYVLWNIAAA